MVAYSKRPDYSLVKHTLIPLFGVLANIGCMMFYLIGPFLGIGTSKEPLGALCIAFLWGAYGAFYFMKTSKAKGRDMLLQNKAQQA
jgi:APA family basic amino acid/polyamine antiporter